jgi:hypothetical protein
MIMACATGKRWHTLIQKALFAMVVLSTVWKSLQLGSQGFCTYGATVVVTTSPAGRGINGLVDVSAA